MSKSEDPGVQHPGKILLDQFLKPRGLPPRALARALRVSSSRIHRLVHGDLGITADLALRLSHYFPTDPMFWMTLQAQYDIDVLKRRDGERIAAMVSRSQDEPRTD